MKRRQQHFESVSYPTDDRGFAVPLEELGFSRVERRGARRHDENEHHMYYYARLFGRFVLSQTFHDIQSNIARMNVGQHSDLHNRFRGSMELPPLENMLERVEQAKDEGEVLFIRRTGGYITKLITDDKMIEIQNEYMRIRGEL